MLLTHPHFDHIANLDWLAANYSRYAPPGSWLPIYATRNCWDEVLQRFPWLKPPLNPPGLDGRELLIAEWTTIDEAHDLRVKAFPVYHGSRGAPGAVMLLIKYQVPEKEKIRTLFTGDLLCPLLREVDYEELSNLDAVFVDANTRFPWPRSGHWSIVRESRAEESILSDWFREIEKGDPTNWKSRLIEPHDGQPNQQYFDEVFKSINPRDDLCWTIQEFVARTKPKNVYLVHYSGYEDHKHHGEAILTDANLLEWVQQTVKIPGTSWHVPMVGALL